MYPAIHHLARQAAGLLPSAVVSEECGWADGCFLLLSFMVWEWGLWLPREDFGRVDGGDGAVGPDDDDPGRADRRRADAARAALGGSCRDGVGSG
jgi:hypothetical protein